MLVNGTDDARTSDADREIDDLIEQGIEEGMGELDHEYAVYVQLHADADWPEGALRALVTDLRSAHPRIEAVDAPAHDVVISVDGDGLDARSAAERALERISAAVAARGLGGHAADVTVISDTAVWAYDRETVAGW